ncbi:MAG: carotenoid oxygenase family protein [Cyanobacteriota bacterium]|nr:carotenoid oxygenase family protein [Cyanobacteriota bacterium]
MVTAATPTSRSYSNADWQQGYASLLQEHSYWIDEVEGQIPAELEGCLFRNGPGRLGVKDHLYGHPFDGDGMIARIQFQAGRAHFANAFVKTPEFLAEQAAGKILYRGVFGTQKPGGWLANCFDLQFKNPANTHVIYHAQKLWALWEASLPYQLDPVTLETRQQETFAGVLGNKDPFTAHPKLDPHTGDLFAFGVRAGLDSTLLFYRINPQGQLVEKSEHRIPGFAFLHDFVWTPHYRVFFQNPVSFNPLPFILGWQSAGTCLKLDPKAATRILIFNWQGEMITLETEPGFVFHYVNGFEQADQQLVMDVIFYEEYPSLKPNEDYRQINFDYVPAGKLYRFELDLLTKTVNRYPLSERSVEFPTIHPRTVGGSHRYIYIGATHAIGKNAPLQAILKVDVKTGQQELHSFAPRGFVGEPVYVPRPGSTAEDDGWVIVLVFNAATQRSMVAILDAQSFSKKPLALLHLKHHVPYGLHGMFTPEVFDLGI